MGLCNTVSMHGHWDTGTHRHACMTSLNSTSFPLYNMMYLQTYLDINKKAVFMTVYSLVSIVVIQCVQPVHSLHMYHGEGVREELGFLTRLNKDVFRYRCVNVC